MGTGNSGFCEAGLRRLREVLARYVDSGRIPGMVALVSRGGQTHVEALGTMRHDGGAPMRRDTIFRMASTTKPVAVAATMVLLDECRLRLDDPVDLWLPELADRKVLKRADGPLEDTVPARRPITVRDLLGSTCGLGLDMTARTAPMMSAFFERGVYGQDGWLLPAVEPDEWMRRLGTLPLMHQPGERWLYNVSDDVLGVLAARGSGQSFESFLRERLFTPLGMKDTGCFVPADKIDRLPPLHAPDPQTGEFKVEDPAEGGHHSKPPAFPSGGGGLDSTVDDYHAYFRMLLNGGMHGGERILLAAHWANRNPGRTVGAVLVEGAQPDDWLDEAMEQRIRKLFRRLSPIMLLLRPTGLTPRMTAAQVANGNIEAGVIARARNLGPVLDNITVPTRYVVASGKSFGSKGDEQERHRATFPAVAARNSNITIHPKVASTHASILKKDFRAVAAAVRKVAAPDHARARQR
ncbi:serine hydrolase domain-containing protein [Streptomyces noursei]|uniref:serine hydrolase domain-containing protein n=1 Tax=Streptomyces noursei TaxID=1971 RepID=UPI001F043782|nr:serine hydrolase domain-containing protein [Streptomyces noursei]